MPIPLSLVTDRLGDDLVLTLHGELDLSGKEPFEEVLDDPAFDEIERFFVDMRGLTFIDSTGVGLLLTALRTAEERGFGVGFVPGEGHVRSLLDEIGVSNKLPLVDVNALPRL